MDFTAIDFETATGSRDSACSVALVRVAGGRLVDSFHTLIRPPGNRYSSFNISIHGIRGEDTAGAEDFAGIWPELLARLSGRLVVAHNAPFDMGVLKACLARYDLDWPSFSYADTVAIARRAWPELPNHKLNTVAEHLGIHFHHHDALEDARTCAEIPLRAGEAAGDFRAFARELGVAVVPF